MRVGGRCPTGARLSEAMSAGLDRELALHLDGCAACAAEWARMRRDVEIARAIAWDEPSPERVEEVRTRVLTAAAASKGAARNSVSRRAVAVALAAACAALIAAGALVRPWSRGADRAGDATPVYRAAITPRASARFSRERALPDEIVRLYSGTIEVDVEHLGPGERFRVVTGDGEVEVHGTSFEVAADADRLIEVRVHRGVVEVRHAQATSMLEVGDEWRAPAQPDSSKAVRASNPPGDAPPHRVPARARTEGPVRPEAVGQRTSEASEDRGSSRSRKPPEAAPLKARWAGRTPGEAAFGEAWRALDAGDRVAAARGFAKAIEFEPDGAIAEDARYWLAVSLARDGKRAEARRALREFLDLHAASARAGQVSVMAGWFALDEGDVAEAKERFEAGASDRSKRVRESAEAGLRALQERGRAR